ncbi:T9SS type A sorting domain-containing protein [Flavivirga eckloniae]|uniref:Secretion system C-terminal sorting domain-containing protein n=1 Tax=Flavivirga eckloniae TaxID=1803846 RepID=A0A2K9PQ05_9FLAO|nr:T9SS type A sorting domain-containing protein [Flavivirga eckloniae]AUP79142.1 hypothetical protein C1H87_10695 [Flavivirga eckloniae]
MKIKFTLYLLIALIYNLSQSQINTLIEGKGTISSGVIGINDLTIDNNENQIIVGRLSHISDFNNDFDPGENIYELPNVNSLSGTTGFIASYSKMGELNYALQITDADIKPFVNNILVESDSANNIYVYGVFTGKADFDGGNNIQELSNATIYTSGNFLSSYDKDGNFRYAIPFPSNAITNSFTTIPKFLSVDKDGNSYLLFKNNYDADFDFDNGTGEFLIPWGTYVLSYDTNGNFRFGHQVPNNTKDIGFDSSGNYLITGTLIESIDHVFDFDPSNSVFSLGDVNNSSFFFASYSKDGDLNFVKDIKGPNAAPVAIVGNNNNIFIAGEMGAGIIDFDPSENEYNVEVSGFEYDLGDMFFAKYTTDGSLVYAKAIQDKVGNVSSETITDFEVDADGNVYITGSLLRGIIDFDLSESVAEVKGGVGGISSTPGDLFVASYDNNGDYKFAYSVVSFINHSILEINPHCSFYYLSGNFQFENASFEFFQEGTPFQIVTGDNPSGGLTTGFITKIKEGSSANETCSSLSTKDHNNIASNIKLSPIPITDRLDIDLPSNIKILNTRIFNLMGQEIYSSLEHKTNLELHNLDSGLYILNLKTNQGNASFKIMKN